MAVNDHGLEVLKKSGEELTSGDKSDYYHKVGGKPDASPGSIPPIGARLEDDAGNRSTLTQIGADKPPGDLDPRFALDVATFEGALTEIIDNTGSPGTVFIGRVADTAMPVSFEQPADTSLAIWQIQRITTTQNFIITQFAGTGAFDQIFDDRADLFQDLPFENAFSLQFDGANDRVEWLDNAVIDFDRLDANSGFIWVKTADSSATTYIEKNSSSTGYRLYFNAQNLTFEYRATGTGDRIRVRVQNIRATVQDGNWHQVGWTYDGSGNASGVAIYLDGVAQTIDIQNDTLTGSTLNVGALTMAARSGGGSNFGPGNMDELALWDVELTSGEVTTIYNSGVALDLQGQGASPITASLVFWSRNGDGLSDIFPTIQDVEALLNGTMLNMTAGDIESEVPS